MSVVILGDSYAPHPTKAPGIFRHFSYIIGY
jgi:hypothetical protein